MLEGLTAARAGRLGPEVAGADLVVEVAAQDAPFDEGVAPGGVALVVDVDGATGLLDGGVVDDGDEVAGDGLADAVRVVAGALAVEVGLKAVADGLVQEDAAVASGEDDGHLARGGVDGLLLEHRLAGGLAGGVLGGDLVEVLDTEASAAAGTGSLAVLAALGEGHHVEAHQGLHVADDLAIAAGDEDDFALVGDAGVDTGDAGVVGAGGAIRALKESDLGSGGLVAQERVLAVVALGSADGGGVDGGGAVAAVADARGRAGGEAHGFGVEGLGVGVTDAVALDHADADALLDAAGSGLDLLVFEADGAIGAVLEEKLGEIAALGERIGEEGGDAGGVDTVALGEELAGFEGGIGHSVMVAHARRKARRAMTMGRRLRYPSSPWKRCTRSCNPDGERSPRTERSFPGRSSTTAPQARPCWWWTWR